MLFRSTSSPNRKLSIQTTGGDLTNGLSIQYNGDEVASFTSNASSGEIRIGGTGIGAFYTTFYTNNTERMRIDSSGNVSVGTSTALLTAAGRGNITINGSSNSILTLGVGGSAAAWFYTTASETYLSSTVAMIFETSSAEKMRLTAAGNQIGRASCRERV